MEDVMSVVEVSSERFIEIAYLLSLARTFRESARAVNLSPAQREEMGRKAEILQRVADRIGR